MITRWIARSGVGTAVTDAVGCAVADGVCVGANVEVGITVTAAGLNTWHASKDNMSMAKTE
jgi:hypothetical protein